MSDIHLASRQQAADPHTPLVVAPKTAATMLSMGLTRLYELLNSGALQSYYDGSSRRIPMSSITAYIQRKLEATKATEAPARRKRGRPKGSKNKPKP